MPLKFGITQKLAAVFILFAALILTGVGLVAYSSGRNSLRSATISELLATAIEKEAGLNSWVEEKQRDIARVSTDPQIVEITAGLLSSSSGLVGKQVFRDLLQAEFEHYVASGEFLDLLLLDPITGEVLAASNPEWEGRSKQEQPYFINGRNGPYIQNLYYSSDFQGPSMAASAPIRSADGQLLAVLAGRIDLTEMNTIISRRTGLRQADDAFLLNTSGQFVTQPRLLTDPAVLQRRVDTPAALSCLQGNSGLIEAPEYRGVPAIVVYRWMPQHRLCLIVKLEEAEAYAPVRAFGTTVAGISLLVLIAAAMLATALSHTLTRPILRLRDGLVRFRGGERQLELPIQRADELGVVAHEFNLMAASLASKERDLREHALTLEQRVQERTLALQETLSQLQRAEEIGQIGSWEWAIPENRVIASEGFHTLLGLSAEDFGTTFDAYFARIHPDDVAETRQALENAMRTGLFESEVRVTRGDGEIRHLYARGEAFRDDQGHAARMIGIVIDITERRQAEEAIRESEDKFKFVFEYSLIGKSITLPDGTVNLNRSFAGMLGYSIAELQNKKWQEITHPDDLAMSSEAIAPLVAGEKNSVRFTKRYLHKSGSVVWADVSTVVRRDGEGKPQYFITALLDITERKQAEARINDLLMFNDRILNTVPVGLLTFKTSGACDFANENAGSILGATVDKLLAQNFRSLDSWKRSGLLDLAEEAIACGFPVSGDIHHISTFGKDLWLRASAVTFRSNEEERLLLTISDITERKKAEEALRLENERFMRFFHSNIVGMVIANAQGGIVLANDYYLNLLGVSQEELLAGSVDWRQYTPAEWLAADEKALQELQDRGVCDPYEKEYIRADGTRVPVYLADAMLPGPEGNIAAFVLDISDRKRAEQAVERITNDLLRSNAELEQFAYVASHDLQEPLRMVSSYMQLLARRYQGKLDSDADEFIGYAVDGAKRMQNLINDLLAYSRVGTRGSEFTPVSAEFLLQEALANLQLTIEDTQAKITHDALPPVLGDPIQLSMIFQNLLGNAMKFRGAETPCIHIGVQEEEGNWIFSVRDNGIGLDPKFAERIFVIFQRLNDRSSYPGTGIGLAICKRIIQRHGGRIWVESQPGQGATFLFTLPSLDAR
ncbi:MAG TPA: PAS domain S-box protein [Anaerolineales bacterium]|nr:PAS domain S-box protein [Anaerolineales bacterium]